MFDPALPSHFALFTLEDPTAPELLRGQLALDIPTTDTNGNGFPDILESSQAVIGAQTQGFYQMDFDEGSVVAVWNRAAGSHAGVCQLTLTSSTFGALPEFTAAFEILEYVGTLTYEPGEMQVQATLAAAQTGYPANTLHGSAVFEKSATNRFDQLTLQAGAWTNAANQTLTFDTRPVFRDLALRTNYFGPLEFADGDPDTPIEDYYSWQLSIDDLNDADADGIPDFSDDPMTTTGQPPILRLLRTNDSLLLEIQGEAGRVYDVEQTPALPPPNWAVILSVPQTNQSQTVELPRPDGTAFWRVRVR